MPLFRQYIAPGTKLAPYKYAVGNATPLDQLLNPWWEVFVKILPKWMAPNLVTLIGFFCSIIPFFMILWYTPTPQQPFPRLGCAAVAGLVFAYQTLDAVDGKHARRTGNASALGQLFDHGCDILSMNLLGLSALGVFGCEMGLIQFLTIIMSGQIQQFMYLWVEYHSHVFYCSTGWIGVTEAQSATIILCLLCALYGPNLFSTPLVGPCLSMLSVSLPEGFPDDLRTIFMMFLITLNTYIATYFIWRRGFAAMPSEALPLAAAQLFAFLFFVIAEYFFYNSVLLVMQLSPGPCYIAMTTAYSIILIRLLLSSCCGMSYRAIQWPVIPFFAVTIALVTIGGNPKWITTAKWLVMGINLWQFVYLGDLLVSSVKTIKECLQIRCFHVADPSKPAGSKKAVEAPAVKLTEVEDNDTTRQLRARLMGQ